MNDETGIKTVVEDLTQPKKPISPAEYKKLMGVYFTQRYSRVEHCNHTFHPENEPRTNCQYCWFAYFQIHGETTQTADECFQKDGKAMLVRVRGERFTKNFLRFMATLAYMKENKINGFERGLEGNSGDREGLK